MYDRDLTILKIYLHTNELSMPRLSEVTALQAEDATKHITTAAFAGGHNTTHTHNCFKTAVFHVLFSKSLQRNLIVNCYWLDALPVTQPTVSKH